MSELPEGWVAVKMREAGDVQLGRQRSPDFHHGPNMRPYLRVANVHDDELRIEDKDVMKMHFDEADVERYELHPDDILLNEGQSLELVGRPAMYRGELPGACFTNSLIRFRASELVIPRFALHVFRHYVRQGDFSAIAKITTNIAHLSANRFAEMEFPLPPLAEQVRIANKIDALGSRSKRAREILDEIPALVGDFRRSVLTAAFRGDLTADWREDNPDGESGAELLTKIRLERRRRWEEAELNKMLANGEPPADRKWMEKYEAPEPVDATGLPQLPEGWCWAGLSEIAEIQLGQRRAPEYADETTYPYVRAANITWRGLDLSDVKSMGFADPRPLFLKPGDVLLNEASGSSSEVGKPAIWRGEIADCCFQATVLRVRSFSDDLHGNWLHLAFLRDALIGKFAEMAPGMGIVHLTAERMRNWPIPLAPCAEQARLVEIVLSCLQRSYHTEDMLADLRSDPAQADAAILAKAFRGELAPRDPTDETASALLERVQAKRAETATKPSPERPKAPVKRTAMSNQDMKDRIRAAIRDQTFDRFSFEKLREMVPGNYDALKASLFDLLEEEPPVVRQVFDKETKAIRLQRVKP